MEVQARLQAGLRQLGELEATAAHPAAVAAPTPVVADVGSFRGLILAEVRRAIVLNEILGAPVALRHPQWLDRY